MIDAIGYAAGALAMVTFLPQLIKTVRTRSAGDISMLMLVLTLSTNVLYVIYGVLLNLYPVVIMLGVMSCTVLLQIVLTVKYGRNAQMAGESDPGDGK